MATVMLMYSFQCCIYRLEPTSPANCPRAAAEVHTLRCCSLHPAGMHCQNPACAHASPTAVQALIRGVGQQDEPLACHPPRAGQSPGCRSLLSPPLSPPPLGLSRACGSEDLPGWSQVTPRFEKRHVGPNLTRTCVKLL